MLEFPLTSCHLVVFYKLLVCLSEVVLMHLHLLFRFAFSPSPGVRVSHSDSLGPFQGFQIVGRERKTRCSWMEAALPALDLFVWRSTMDSERRHVTLKTRNTPNYTQRSSSEGNAVSLDEALQAASFSPCVGEEPSYQVPAHPAAHPIRSRVICSVRCSAPFRKAFSNPVSTPLTLG